MEEFLKAAGNFGFPIVVAAYLLLRQEKKVEQLATMVQENTGAIVANTGATKELKEVIERRLK